MKALDQTKLSQESLTPEVSTQDYLKQYSFKSHHLLKIIDENTSPEEAKEMKVALKECSDLVESYRFKSKGEDYDYGNKVVSKHANIIQAFSKLQSKLSNSETALGKMIISDIYDLVATECKKFVNPAFKKLYLDFYGRNY